VKRRRLLLVAGVGAVAVLSLVLLVFVPRGGTHRNRQFAAAEETRYTSRTLLLPDTRYRMPDAEEQLLNPGYVLTVDPDRPLPPELAEWAERDLLEALREQLTTRLEAEVEHLLFP
jgi:hypothetical protein